jgi:hypothetical protein
VKDQDHFVYVIATKRDGTLCAPIKVGISGNPKKRIAAIRTSCPNKIEFAFTFCLPGREMALDLEGVFHRTFASSGLNGEWFDVSPYEAVFVLASAIRDNLTWCFGQGDRLSECLDKSGVTRAEAIIASLGGGSTIQ